MVRARPELRRSMNFRQADAEASGVNVITTVIANNEPDDDALSQCQELGKSLA